MGILVRTRIFYLKLDMTMLKKVEFVILIAH